MSEYTPGPWKVVSTQVTWEATPDLSVVDRCNETVARIGQREAWNVLAEKPKEQDANARLIAAAPEMYEALRQIQSLRDRDESGEGFSDDEGEDVIGIVDDLLAKIDG